MPTFPISSAVFTQCEAGSSNTSMDMNAEQTSAELSGQDLVLLQVLPDACGFGSKAFMLHLYIKGKTKTVSAMVLPWPWMRYSKASNAIVFQDAKEP